MNRIKELTVFTNGDSSDINSWSNIPFFFTETAKSKGVKVNRVDIGPSINLKQKFDRSYFYRIIKKVHKNTSYDYFRSIIHFKNVRVRIKRAIRQYPDSDAYIFLTFSFSSTKLTNKPTVLLCDWTYDYYFKYFLNRKPDFFEKQSIRRENLQISGSDLVFSLFPGVADYMKKKYCTDNIYYIGNVINSICTSSRNEILCLKKQSYKLLFIGKIKYIEGARSLIEAFKLLKPKYPQLSLHFIGLYKTDFKSLPTDIYCHGYLEKGKDSDRELYYRLLKEAKIFINTTPKWSAFSASIEAMYFYTPIIVTPYNEFVEIFGDKIEFGAYCEKNTRSCIAEKIETLFNNDNYEELCNKAHHSVKEYTWSAYIDKMIALIEQK